MTTRLYKSVLRYCREPEAHSPTDTVIYEGIAKACIEKGYTSQALEYLQKAAEVCLETKQYERFSYILSQMRVLEGGAALAAALEQRYSHYSQL
ncbi:MAG: hypothetical protein RMI34_12045 [Chloroherpetonaceae bacterium]|nr:hypothetical protein [Chloroherpetonaceae bacterium]MCS7210020.1 hypothetical protein [Chloroherpetonaceae bacterium]MDW8020788.1 hypothetical protein [Chloroherpetonaceae bacterium]MDW8464680.1 hypothetical protein [Chloroherpetonaceae bacterium]